MIFFFSFGRTARLTESLVSQPGILTQAPTVKGSLSSSVVKNPLADAGDNRRGFDPWVGEIPWRKAWQSTPVFLPGESHGQRSLAG